MQLPLNGESAGLLTARVSDDSPLEPGSLITYANDLDISQDGTIYFTDRYLQHMSDRWLAGMLF